MITQRNGRVGLDPNESTGDCGERTLEWYVAIQTLPATDVKDGGIGALPSGVGHDHVVKDRVTPFASPIPSNERSPLSVRLHRA
jgi:hypothetical protein